MSQAAAIQWAVCCDRDGCTARVYATRATDHDARDEALARAASEGWLIEVDRFIRPRLDLCPAHRGA